MKFSDSLRIYCFVFLLKSSLQNRQLLCRSIYFLCMIKVSQLDMKGVLLKLISLVFSMATVKSQVDGNSTSACSGASSGFPAIHDSLYSYTGIPVVGSSRVVCVYSQTSN